MISLMNNLRFLSALFAIVFVANVSVAQEAPGTVATVEIATSEASRPLDAARLETLWGELILASERGDLAAASDLYERIVVARDSLGIRDLPRYAAALIEYGRRFDSIGQRDEARLFYRWGYKLAPHSPEILWSVLPVASRLNVESTAHVLGLAIRETIFSPFRALTIIHLSIYPVLLAFSIALFLAFMVTFCSQVMDIFRVLAWRVKPEKRGWLIPLMYVALVCAPLFLGFLWCLTCWAVVLYLLLPERRFLSLTTAIVVIAWGTLTPLRENIASWLADARVKRVVLSGEQPLAEEEKTALKDMMSEWRSDSVVQYKLAQLLRRAGDTQEAQKILDRLSADGEERAWILAEEGVLKFLSQDIAGSESTLRHAIELDDGSPEVMFNLSKVVFEKNDTKESRELFGRALKLNKSRVESMRVREDVLGIHDPRSFADAELPLKEYFAAALIPNARSFDRANGHASVLMWGLDPSKITIVGFLLLAMHLLPGTRSRRINPKGLFDGYQPGFCTQALERFIPAGKAIAGEHLRFGFFSLTIMVLAVIPFVSGAYGQGEVLERLRWFMPYHLCMVSLIYLVSILVSLNKSER